MTTWNDLIITNPPDTEVVSNGAFRIRQVVDAGKTTTAVEHYQTGEHKFPVAEPGTPMEGQIWFDVTNRIVRIYSGGQWNIVSGAALYSTRTNTQLNLIGSYQSVLSIANVSIPTNGECEVAATVGVFKFSAGKASYSFRVVRDTTVISPVFSGIIENDGTLFTTTISPLGYDDAATAGNHTYAIEALSTYSDVWVSGRIITVKVI